MSQRNPFSSFDGVGTRAMDATTRALMTAVDNMGIQDFILPAFHAFLFLRVKMAPIGQNQILASRITAALFLTAIATIMATRGGLLREGWPRSLAYRLGLFLPALASYFALRPLLPALQPRLLDGQFYEVDKLLFGETPSRMLEQFVNPATTEWFAFFYYSYFLVLGLNLLPLLFFGRGQVMREVLIGTLVVVTLGHVSYTFFPGVGPWKHLAFDTPLVGTLWWPLVTSTVEAAGAQIDIFPSLHTAYPTFFALMAIRHRRIGVYKYLWPVGIFFAINIIIATLFLRWHWGVDVVFGVLLAVAAREFGIRASAAQANRPAEGRQYTFEPLGKSFS